MADLTSLPHQLIEYVVHHARTLDTTSSSPPPGDLKPYYDLLASHQAASLHPIVTALQWQADAAQVAQPSHRLAQLSHFIQRETVNSERDITIPLQAVEQLDSAARFEAITSLIRDAATALPGTRREAGVSLYHEFKLVSALLHATQGNPEHLKDGFTLISGELPGVQRFIYNIPSDGATKRVRGRSFFLQLLTDCIVLRLLRDLGSLPLTNALTVAGSKFTLLAPPGDSTVETLQRVEDEINTAMLHAYDGMLRLVLGWADLPGKAISDATAYRNVTSAVREHLGRRKLKPFASMFHATLFTPQEDRNADLFPSDTAEDEGDNTDAYRQLAEALAKARDQTSVLTFTHTPRTDKSHEYARLLHRLTGIAAMLGVPNTTEAALIIPQQPELSFALNRVEFHTEEEDGFRLLAVQTPLIKQPGDIQYAKEHRKEGKHEDDRLPKVGDIRDFELLAVQPNKKGEPSGSLQRYGVLRMDVDNLGSLFSGGLNPGTITRYLALSDGLNLFFEGYLPMLCKKLEEEKERSDSLYLIYGGGDDLFIVGEWDLLPELAERIHSEFHKYTDGKMSISAAIGLFSQRFPLYRAATDVGNALDNGAKELEREETHNSITKVVKPKNAISFLDQAVSWTDWTDSVRPLYKNLKAIANSPCINNGQGSDVANRIVLDLHSQWREERDTRLKQSRTEHRLRVVTARENGQSAPVYAQPVHQALHYGPHRWRAMYALTRLAERYAKKNEHDSLQTADEKQNLRNALEYVKRAMLDKNQIALTGLAARWLELEQRTREHEPKPTA